ncbi:GntR family transcriptional regulator [Streptomyces sp. HPF1205]|uniref:GntR family transcriptional regulator n=1 Tax=Streptomyces sp. HPF1205 TaxID=2873262 RepID=UPI0027DFC721|nr:GntR family transcriptional regulator [Streptomyces sp. HPF1205]
MSARHQQVADDLRRRIRSGDLPVGRRLPSESALAAQYRSASRPSVKPSGCSRSRAWWRSSKGAGTSYARPFPASNTPEPTAEAST